MSDHQRIWKRNQQTCQYFVKSIEYFGFQFWFLNHCSSFSQKNLKFIAFPIGNWDKDAILENLSA